ncbi:hypothetical protein R1sor_009373 [Riccia sorocarpa]|uniref:Myb-like domain-containing protein n=1 Tax=Riccia sorocarpa TaxID=122646 RepID=A0ABD3HUW8_9MARC
MPSPVTRVGAGDNDEDDGENTVCGREDWETKLLIEAKKLEEMDCCTNREQMVNVGKKWRKIVSRLALQGMRTTVQRFKNKWNTTIREFKKINDHEGKTGNAPYASNTPNQRRETNLEMDFDVEWIDWIASFLALRPCLLLVVDSSAPGRAMSIIDDSDVALPTLSGMTGKRKCTVRIPDLLSLVYGEACFKRTIRMNRESFQKLLNLVDQPCGSNLLIIGIR